MSRIWDWLTGQAERDAELARQRAQEAREADLKRLEVEAARKPPEPIQRVENEPRPGERFMPDQIERQRHLHDHPPPERLRYPVVREATRMENTMTPQPAPILGGPGMIFTNRRAGPSVAKKLLDAGQAHRDAQPQPNLQPDMDAARAPGSNPLFPDSEGLQLKPPTGKKPGEENQQ